jgi:hypothetical protein
MTHFFPFRLVWALTPEHDDSLPENLRVPRGPTRNDTSTTPFPVLVLRYCIPLADCRDHLSHTDRCPSAGGGRKEERGREWHRLEMQSGPSPTSISILTPWENKSTMNTHGNAVWRKTQWLCLANPEPSEARAVMALRPGMGTGICRHFMCRL